MPLSVRSAGGSKGSFYGDASYRTAALRKQSILAGQRQKCGNVGPVGSCQILSGANALKKPFIGEHHLQKGFTSGVTEVISLKNPNSFI